MGKELEKEVELLQQPLSERRAELRETAVWTASLARQQGPLIDQVTNSWRDNKVTSDCIVSADDGHELRFCALEDEESCPNVSRDLMRSRRFRKMFLIVITICIVLWYGWRWYVQPRLDEEWDFKQGFLSAGSNGTFGLARGGDFGGTWLKDLDEKIVPGGPSDPAGKRRLVFVGDIHGCKQELVSLLEAVEFNIETDHLIPTGDVVSKGPDNVGVLDELIRLGADSVRGNHEDRLLEAAKTLLSTNMRPQSAAATGQGYSKDATLVAQLKPKHMDYLRQMPLMLRIPTLPLASSHTFSGKPGADRITSEILVVHAGLVPHVPLPMQDPYMVMNMRSIDSVTHVPSALRTTKKGDSKPWFTLWGWYNARLAAGKSIKGFHVYSREQWLEQQVPESRFDRFWRSMPWVRGRGRQKKPQTVIYGHDSKAGLQLHRWNIGLDSGCVGGGELSALVLDAYGNFKVKSVGCKNYRT